MPIWGQILIAVAIGVAGGGFYFLQKTINKENAESRKRIDHNIKLLEPYAEGSKWLFHDQMVTILRKSVWSNGYSVTIEWVSKEGKYEKLSIGTSIETRLLPLTENISVS